MKGVGEAELERGAVEHGGLLGERHLVEVARRRRGLPEVGDEVPLRPAGELPHLEGGEHAVLARRDGRQAHGVAVDPGPGQRALLVALIDAEGVENLPAQLAELVVFRAGGQLGELGQVGGIGEILRRAGAKAGGEARVDPAEAGEAQQDGQDVVGEGDGGGLGQPLRVHEERAQEVIHGAHGHEVGRVVGRGDDHPRAVARDGLAVDDDGGGHGAVGDVVVPAVVVGEGGGGRAVVRGGDAVAAEDEQAAGGVGAQLAEIDGRAEEIAVEGPGGTGCICSLDTHEAAVDGEAGAVGALIGGVARQGGIDGGRRQGRLGDVEGDLELIPGGLLVGEMDGPGDGGVGGGELGDNVAGGVVAVDAEERGLAFERAGAVLVETGRARLGVRDLGADVVGVGAVAHAGDADGGVDGGADDGGEIGGGGVAHDWEERAREVATRAAK